MEGLVLTNGRCGRAAQFAKTAGWQARSSRKRRLAGTVFTNSWAASCAPFAKMLLSGGRFSRTPPGGRDASSSSIPSTRSGRPLPAAGASAPTPHPWAGSAIRGVNIRQRACRQLRPVRVDPWPNSAPESGRGPGCSPSVGSTSGSAPATSSGHPQPVRVHPWLNSAPESGRGPGCSPSVGRLCHPWGQHPAARLPPVPAIRSRSASIRG